MDNWNHHLPNEHLIILITNIDYVEQGRVVIMGSLRRNEVYILLNVFVKIK